MRRIQRNNFPNNLYHLGVNIKLHSSGLSTRYERYVVTILNYDMLTNHGNIQGRKDALAIIDAGFRAADPRENIKKLIAIENGIMRVGCPEFEPVDDPRSGTEVIDLGEIDHIYVVGAAKGSAYVAAALEEVLGPYLTGGHIIGKHGDPVLTRKIGVTLAGHPLPDEDCINGCEQIYEIARRVSERDLVFTIAGNGISSLLTWPVEGVSLDEVREVTRILQIEKGVITEELNLFRNHVDRMKGGKITRYFIKAKLIHIVPDDLTIKVSPGCVRTYDELVHGNVWLHTLPECSTFAQAVEMLKFHHVWEDLSENIKRYFLAAPASEETVKYEEYKNWDFRIFGILPVKQAIFPAVFKKAEELGYTPLMLCEAMRAEAMDVGKAMALIALNIERLGQPLRAPVALFSMGEMLVTVGKEAGIGGRNQEYAAGAALVLDGSRKVVVVSADTDGTDGPGGFKEPSAPACLSGAIVDGYTHSESIAAGIDLRVALREHNTTPALWPIGCGLVKEQNVGLTDLTCILVAE